MDRRISLYVSSYVVVLIGYFLLLTVGLPSLIVHEPPWVEAGAFAEYIVEDKGGSSVVMNGTYTWEILGIHNGGIGGRVATVNETFKGSTHWDHIKDIPPDGRLVNVSVRAGAVGDLLLWVKRYYNRMLLGRSFFVGEWYACQVLEELEMPIKGEFRESVEILPKFNSFRWADYDKATGLLLGYRWTWPRLGTVFVSLNSTNVSLSSSDGNTGNWLTAMSDALLVSPLFILPIVGAMVGLTTVRQQRIGFSRHFWLSFILLNGSILTFLANWPLQVPSFFYPYLYAQALYLGLILTISIDLVFWTTILAAAVIIIDRFAFPIIAKSV